MKTLVESIKESYEVKSTPNVTESEETIKDEKSFREFARAKFEEVFGDDLDEDRMKETVDGILEDNEDLVEADEWGELVGILNKSFAPN